MRTIQMKRNINKNISPFVDRTTYHISQYTPSLQYAFHRNINHRNINHDSDEEDPNSTPNIPDIASLLKEEKKLVFRFHNHIYFRCEVTMDKINKLCNLIEDYNREQDALRYDCTSAIIVPKPIYLHITSMGGDMMGGFLAYDYIKNSRIPIYTIAEGYTVSSGANMFMAGQKRFMTENSYILVHQLSQTSNYGINTFHDMMDNAANIVEFMSKLYGIYLNNIRHNRKNVCTEDILTKEKLENHMLHDIYWNYETCLRFGIVDELYTNYVDTDVNDIQCIVKHKSCEPIKYYSLQELRPSEEVIDRIRQNNEQTKHEVTMSMLKSLSSTNSTIDIVNKSNNNNRKVLNVDELDESDNSNDSNDSNDSSILNYSDEIYSDEIYPMDIDAISTDTVGHASNMKSRQNKNQKQTKCQRQQPKRACRSKRKIDQNQSEIISVSKKRKI